jgi:FkbM family methyltransferase
MMNAVHVGGDRVLCVNALGMLMYVDGRDISLAPHILAGAVWETHMTNLFKRVLEPGMTFVDVGANFGWFTLVAAAQVGAQGKVIAVEANPETHDLLTTNVEINGFADRVTTWNKAAWHERANLDFHVMRKHKGSASLRSEVEASAHAFHDDTETIRVDAMCLDDMIGDDVSVDLVKIDAEGAEPNVWRGMRRTIERNKDLCVSVEFAACWYPNGGAEKFLDDIEASGFKIRKIGPNSQLLAPSRDDLLRIPHNDLMIVPQHMNV